MGKRRSLECRLFSRDAIKTLDFSERIRYNEDNFSFSLIMALTGGVTMFAVVIVCLIFVLLGVLFLLGKGSFLIAGYNTASKEEKAKYDEKRLTRCFSIFCFGIAIVIAACGVVDTDDFALLIGLPAILVLIVLIMILSNTYCKKK